MVGSMNGYYSNLIEGHQTRPEDIEKALKNEFSDKPKQKDLQILHLAHMHTLAAMEDRLEKDPSTRICTPEFLQWIHGTLYGQLPISLRMQEDGKGNQFEVKPGEIRDHNVAVGQHVGPPFASLPKFFGRFAAYEPYVSMRPEGIINGMAAHHRLAWLHPFPDGNGRVARLFTHAWFLKAGLLGLKMWTLSRGLARSKDEYYTRLVEADAKRHNDYDGRGVRSLKNLVAFCDFMLRTSIDQVAFMEDLLAPEHFLARADAFMAKVERHGTVPPGSAGVFRAAISQGQISRGAVMDFAGKSRRSGVEITGAMLKVGLLKSEGLRGPLLPAFPPWAGSDLFPGLYPAPDNPQPPPRPAKEIEVPIAARGQGDQPPSQYPKEVPNVDRNRIQHAEPEQKQKDGEDLTDFSPGSM
jgi:fido (protein-threonine AMPylation protein)